MVAPRTKAMISGLMYWTTAARWIPIAPAMSRSKQATQMPILVGLPTFCRSGARTPMAAPARTMPQREAKKRVRRSDMVQTS